MRCGRWMGLVAVSALTLALPAADEQTKLELEKFDVKGPPRGLTAGQPARYAIWYDKDGWHLRVTSGGNLAAFTGVIEPLDGKITSVRFFSSNKALPAQRAEKTQTASFRVSLKVGGRVMNGVDLQLADTATAVKFTLKVDDKEVPDRIFIGAQGKHPKGATFHLPAKPEK